jgi:hypothetical protein
MEGREMKYKLGRFTIEPVLKATIQACEVEKGDLIDVHENGRFYEVTEAAFLKHNITEITFSGLDEPNPRQYGDKHRLVILCPTV